MVVTTKTTVEGNYLGPRETGITGIGIKPGPHLVASPGVVLTEHQGNRQEMRELPQEENDEEKSSVPLDTCRGTRRPADQRGHGTRKKRRAACTAASSASTEYR